MWLRTPRDVIAHSPQKLKILKNARTQPRKPLKCGRLLEIRAYVARLLALTGGRPRTPREPGSKLVAPHRLGPSPRCTSQEERSANTSHPPPNCLWAPVAGAACTPPWPLPTCPASEPKGCCFATP